MAQKNVLRKWQSNISPGKVVPVLLKYVSFSAPPLSLSPVTLQSDAAVLPYKVGKWYWYRLAQSECRVHPLSCCLALAAVCLGRKSFLSCRSCFCLCKALPQFVLLARWTLLIQIGEALYGFAVEKLESSHVYLGLSTSWQQQQQLARTGHRQGQTLSQSARPLVGYYLLSRLQFSLQYGSGKGLPHCALADGLGPSLGMVMNSTSAGMQNCLCQRFVKR